mmetsp:Transcript_19627/g.58715  ORF Transcript_19627/g.58715 Transcript_19627/m.58715 type:complete len:328 (+) Transcript_19627:124-1107(+)
MARETYTPIQAKASETLVLIGRILSRGNHGQAQLAVGNIHRHDPHLHVVPDLHRVFDALDVLACDLGDVHEASRLLLHPRGGHVDKSSEARDRLHLAVEPLVLGDILEWRQVRLRRFLTLHWLLHAQRHPACGLVRCQDPDPHRLPRLDLGIDVIDERILDLTDVHQALGGRAAVGQRHRNDGAEAQHPLDDAVVPLARICCREGGEVHRRLGFGVLLEPREGNLAVSIPLDPHFDFLPLLQDGPHVFDTLARNLGDVQEALHFGPDVDECTVRHQPLDNAIDFAAGRERARLEELLLAAPGRQSGAAHRGNGPRRGCCREPDEGGG